MKLNYIFLNVRKSMAYDKEKTLANLVTHLERLPEGQRKMYAQALEASFTIDISGRNQPYDASYIEENFGFNYSAQNQLAISITRPKAEKFLQSISCPTISKGFKNTFNRDKFKEVFNQREAICIYKNQQMLLTYAEWLHFVNNIVQLELPEKIKQYL